MAGGARAPPAIVVFRTAVFRTAVFRTAVFRTAVCAEGRAPLGSVDGHDGRSVTAAPRCCAPAGRGDDRTPVTVVRGPARPVVPHSGGRDGNVRRDLSVVVAHAGSDHRPHLRHRRCRRVPGVCLHRHPVASLGTGGRRRLLLRRHVVRVREHPRRRRRSRDATADGGVARHRPSDVLRPATHRVGSAPLVRAWCRAVVRPGAVARLLLPLRRSRDRNRRSVGGRSGRVGALHAPVRDRGRRWLRDVRGAAVGAAVDGERQTLRLRSGRAVGAPRTSWGTRTGLHRVRARLGGHPRLEQRRGRDAVTARRVLVVRRGVLPADDPPPMAATAGLRLSAHDGRRTGLLCRALGDRHRRRLGRRGRVVRRVASPRTDMARARRGGGDRRAARNRACRTQYGQAGDRSRKIDSLAPVDPGSQPRHGPARSELPARSGIGRLDG